MALKQTGDGKIGLYPTANQNTHAVLYNFDIDGHALKSAHKDFLNTHVVPLLSQGGSTLLQGMSSRTGSDEHNKRLSERRVKDVISHLKREAPATSQILIYHGVGEQAAEDAGQADNLEDEYYRAVSIIVSPEQIPDKIPEKKEKPKPYPPKRETWHKVKMSIRAETLDIFFIKKMLGYMYMSPGFCVPYFAWQFSVSNLSATLPVVKGKPPIWLGKFEALGKEFSYNAEVFDPTIYWKNKAISVTAYGTTLSVTIKNGLPKPPRAHYHPLMGAGVSVQGRDVIFEMKTNSLELGGVGGVGSIKDPKQYKARNCA